MTAKPKNTQGRRKPPAKTTCEHAVPPLIPSVNHYFQHDEFDNYLRTDPHFAGLTEAQIANRLHLSQTQLKQYRTGVYSPAIDLYCRILHLLNEPIGTFLVGCKY